MGRKFQSEKGNKFLLTFLPKIMNQTKEVKNYYFSVFSIFSSSSKHSKLKGNNGSHTLFFFFFELSNENHGLFVLRLWSDKGWNND